MEELVAKLFQSRDIVHIAHLRETSYARHMALDEYYKGIVELVDRLVETSQYNKLLDIKVPQAPVVSDIVQYLEDLYKYVESSYSKMERSYQKQILDDVSELINTAIYKAKFLN